MKEKKKQFVKRIIGVSQWRAEGKKLGYWQYFLDEIKKEIDVTSPSWKDGYTTGKKEEGLASLKREKEAWNRGVEEAIKIVTHKFRKNHQTFEEFSEIECTLQEIIEKLRSLIHKK